jgi:hypothetical protein
MRVNRRLTLLGYLTPAEFEAQWREEHSETPGVQARLYRPELGERFLSIADQGCSPALATSFLACETQTRLIKNPMNMITEPLR